MFKSPFQSAVTFALIALVAKITFFSLEIQHIDTTYIWYVYMLLLLVAIYFGIRTNIETEKGLSSFSGNFKTGARTASIFALLVAAITYIYYAQIDVNFFDIRIQEEIDSYPQKIANALKDGSMTKEEIKHRIMNESSSIKTIYSPYFHSMFTMFGLVFIGLFNSAVFAFLMKRFNGYK